MNRTVLVTGGARGIGRGIAEKFAQNNYNIIINYYKSHDLAMDFEKSLKDRGIMAMAIRADVSDAQQVKAMVDQAMDYFGKIDVLVNNAGIADMNLITDIKEEVWDRLFDVNVKGVFNCSQAVARGMISEKNGRIINLSSIWGLVGASMECHYSATKGAVIAFSKALAKELGPSGITVNTVAPGAVDTDMIAPLGEEVFQQVREETPLGAIGTVEQIAESVFFLAEKSGNFITGQVLSPNGGLVIY